MEHLEHQRLAKRAATDGQIDASTVTFSPSNGTLKEDTLSVSAHHDNNTPNTSLLSARKQMLDQPKTSSQSLKMSSVLDQIWKNELKSGLVLKSTFGIFGESILPFISVREMSMFI